MPFKITFEPRNRIAGVQPKTIEKDTAAKAWMEVYGLMASDEKVSIIDPSGRAIEWQELKALAGKEAN